MKIAMTLFRANRLLFLAVGLSLSATADPDLPKIGVVRFWNSVGAIRPLERAELVQAPSGSAAPATWEIKGGRSAFRIMRDPVLLFLVRLGEGETPSQIHLYRLTGSGARKPYPPRDSWRTVALSVTSAGDSVGLAPVGELNEGEYAFVRSGSNEAWCFGIDVR
jgi:hypothetical protein